MLFVVFMFLIGVMCITINTGISIFVGILIMLTSIVIGFVIKGCHTINKLHYENLLNEKLTDKEYKELDDMFKTNHIAIKKYE
jgi:uncharacterized membrane protein (DUF485 family)